MIYGRSKKSVIWQLRILTSRKAHPITKGHIITANNATNFDPVERESSSEDKNKPEQKVTLKALSDLTKFRLSQYNTLASYSMYLYYAPTFMPYESLIFL